MSYSIKVITMVIYIMLTMKVQLILHFIKVKIMMVYSVLMINVISFNQCKFKFLKHKIFYECNIYTSNLLSNIVIYHNLLFTNCFLRLFNIYSLICFHKIFKEKCEEPIYTYVCEKPNR